tara:strand:- start:822 stop:941 length:120 start_codon:yes stop_codon:yes gene_type:complete
MGWGCEGEQGVNSRLEVLKAAEQKGEQEKISRLYSKKKL